MNVICIVLLVYSRLIHANNILWSDEFDGEAKSQPSKDTWRYEIGDGSDRGLKGWENTELQYYTDDSSNVAFDGKGNLVITARKSNASTPFSCYYGNCSFTSARLVSTFAGNYGRYEARIKLPSGSGLVPSFWLSGENVGCSGWPNSGEVDIMKMRGSRPNSIFGIIHGPGYSGGRGIASSFTLQSRQTFDEEFHIFAIDWEANRITWSVDDEVYVSRTPDDVGDNPWVFNRPFNIILNLAAGGIFDGNSVDLTEPKNMYVDYVRVYEKPKGYSVSYETLFSSNVNLGTLVWTAEFNEVNGSSPSADQWAYDLGNGPPEAVGWGNGELEYYTNETSNVATDGQGHLVIKAQTENANRFMCSYGPCKYTSTRLTTLTKFSHRYGRFEARIKNPVGPGLWPAFWLMGDNFPTVGWPKCGVIDIMEMKGSQPNSITTSLHGPGYQGNTGITDKYTLPGGQSFADDFHVFAVEWEPNRITFSVDGNEFSTMTRARINGKEWVFDHPFNILVNLAVGGLFDGVPPLDMVFPKNYYIDYVRVYDLGGGNDDNEVLK